MDECCDTCQEEQKQDETFLKRSYAFYVHEQSLNSHEGENMISPDECVREKEESGNMLQPITINADML